MLICHLINAEIIQRIKDLRQPKDIEECIFSNSNVSNDVKQNGLAGLVKHNNIG